MNKTVEVIFTKNIENHLKGDKASVSLGYAKNYLLPKKIAVYANDIEAKEVIKKVITERKELQKIIDETKKTAESLNGKIIELKADASSKGKLFGSIGAEEIAKELKIDKNKLKMKAIKETGEHEVEVDLGNNVKSKIKVIIEENKIKVSKKA